MPVAATTLLTILAFTPVTQAAELYVDRHAGTERGAASAAAPVRSIGAAIPVASPGDTVHVASDGHGIVITRRAARDVGGAGGGSATARGLLVEDFDGIAAEVRDPGSVLRLEASERSAPTSLAVAAEDGGRRVVRDADPRRNPDDLDGDGDAACDGDCDDGRAGLHPSTDTEGATVSGFRAVTAGHAHPPARDSDRRAWGWGDDERDQRSAPDAAPVASSASGWQTCGVSEGGTITCWGRSERGQSTPPDSSVDEVAAGDWNTCSVTTDGTVVCWGDDGYGRSTPSDAAL